MQVGEYSFYASNVTDIYYDTINDLVVVITTSNTYVVGRAAQGLQELLTEYCAIVSDKHNNIMNGILEIAKAADLSLDL